MKLKAFLAQVQDEGEAGVVSKADQKFPMHYPVQRYITYLKLWLRLNYCQQESYQVKQIKLCLT